MGFLYIGNKCINCKYIVSLEKFNDTILIIDINNNQYRYYSNEWTNDNVNDELDFIIELILKE